MENYSDSTELIGSIEHTPYKYKWTCYLTFCNFVAVLATALMGYNTAVVNEPYQIFEQFINASFYLQHNSTSYLDTNQLETIWTLTVSLFIVGGMVGGFLGGPQAIKWGRRRSLMFNCVIGVISGGLMFSAPFVNNFEMLLAGRAVTGLYCGLASAIVPVFVTEMPPLPFRGVSGTINQLAICTGSLVASILGLPVVLGRQNVPILWPFLFFPPLILPIIQFVLLLFTVESPRWLMFIKKDEAAALKSLVQLRGKHVPPEVIATEIADLRREAEEHSSKPILTICQQLWGSLAWSLVICVMMQLAQQLSGINAAIFYSSDIFKKVGIPGDLPQYASLGIIGTTVVMAFVSAMLVERVGRRPLMVFGIGGMWLSCGLVVIFMTLSAYFTATLVYDYLTIVTLICYVATFGIGPGTIPWFIAAELSMPQFRPVAVSLCTFTNWMATLAVGFGYPPLQNALGPYSFLPFFGFLMFFFIFSLVFLPETGGKPAEETIHQLERNKVQLRCCFRNPSVPPLEPDEP